MKNKFINLIVNKEDSILFVLKKMDQSKRKLLIVLDDDKFISLISIGDIQRAIIKGIDINEKIYKILRSEICYATTEDNIEILKKRMKLRRNEMMPIVSPNGTLVDVLLWEDLFTGEKFYENKNLIKAPVIIMAGGEGTRLRPLTNVLPKALIPINQKTILEEIMERFVNYGCHDFFISVNYKFEMIRYYIESLNNPMYNIEYLLEDKPLGTAGGLFLLKGKINRTFFVTNCDIIVDQDYNEIMEYHNNNRNEITIVAALKSYNIPYGTLTTTNNGLLKRIQEKPEYIFKINTGFYVLEPHLLNEIPNNKYYHITSLIESLQKQNRRIGVFPVSEKSWTDIGNWNEYYSYIKMNNEQ